MPDGYPLASFAVFGNLGSTETRFDGGMGNVADFTGLATSVTARLVGSINNLSGTQTTFRLRADTNASAIGVTSPLVATFPVVSGNGQFSIAVTFTPSAGPHMYIVTQQTDAGTGTVDELVFILEAVP
jgi:hypothetical protein